MQSKPIQSFTRGLSVLAALKISEWARNSRWR
jgi:hypothetical protein